MIWFTKYICWLFTTIFEHKHLIKNNGRRRLVTNLAPCCARLVRLHCISPWQAKRIQVCLVPAEHWRRRIPALLACKTRHCRTIHPPVFAQSSAPTSRLNHPFFKHGVKWWCGRTARTFCLGKTESAKITFSKFNFSFAEKFEGTDVFLILWDSCGKK